MIACRFCDAPLTRQVVDLGTSPLANAYRSAEELGSPEPTYPLRVLVCESCLLVQLGELPDPEQLFDSYPYVPSYSTTWLRHADTFAAAMIGSLRLTEEHRVVEIASNDGSLLRGFASRGVPVLGVEPADNLAQQARAEGIPTETGFFDDRLAEELRARGAADLLIANNVLAHVPSVNEFVRGFKILLKPGGLATLEFPHLMRVVEDVQFDTIYHEHVFYLSLAAVVRLFAAHGLRVVDVEQLPIQGGSLRIHVRHAELAAHAGPRVEALLAEERAKGYESLEIYESFGRRVDERRSEIRTFLCAAKDANEAVAAYGAPAKATTLLNSCGIDRDLIDYTADLNPLKQGRFIPGTRIPIERPDRIKETRPDLVFVFAWNLIDEIAAQLSFIREWGARFVVHVPEVGVRP